jgi:hypothetical protein
MSRSGAACGGTPAEAIDSAAAIEFACTIEDHFDRLEWLKMWVHGEWRQMRAEYPEFEAGHWQGTVH